MAMDYKKIINEKRMLAGNLMTESQLASCNAAIHTAAVASGASGFIPIPVADAVPISVAQVTMVMALANIFDQEITTATAKALIGAAAGTFVGRNLIKMIPIAGWIASAGVAAGVTEAIGWIVAVDMAQSFRKGWESKKNESDAAKAYADAEYYRKQNESRHKGAEDFSDIYG